jgi:N-acetylglucosaminyl-diphospho-decaprenol L-rhamnosyltransferase
LSYGEPVAVVAVIHASSAALPGFLASVRAATTEPLDIVVAHQGDPDPTVLAAAARADARVIETGDVGYGRAANLGVRDTTAQYVVVADPDAVWQPGSLDLLLAAAQRWPKGAAFGPLMQTDQGSVYPSARSVPSLTNGIGHALCGRWWPGNPWTKAYRQVRGQPAERTTGWLADTCLLLRRDAFDAIGGFDSEHLVYLEDLDLGERFVKAGWHNVYVPSAVVAASSRQRGATDRSRLAADRHRSVWSYLSRRYAGWRWLPVRVLLRSGLGLRAIAAKRAGPPRRRLPPPSDV